MQNCSEIIIVEGLHMKKQLCPQINHQEIQDGIQDGFQNLLISKTAIIMLKACTKWLIYAM